MRAVWACVVCYRASPATVRALVDVLSPQVSQVLVMDNAADPALAAALPAQTVYVPLESNLGTAGAMNRAWQLALAGGAGGLVCFDQDSTPAPDMVARLSQGWDALQAQGARVAAVGPMKTDPRNQRPFRVLKPVGFLRRFASPDGTDPIEVDHLITSGCLIGAQAFGEIGPYDERLFLDYVDMEWCIRARSKGWRHFSIPGASLVHTIGDDVVSIGRLTLSLHSPLRTYLLVRNHLLLWHLPTMPRPWMASDALQVLKKVAGLLVLAPQRFARLRAVLRGAVDGLGGRGGAP